jgi:transketolase
MEKNEVLELERTALEVRKDIVRMIGLSRAPSLGSSLSLVDILVALYFSILSVRPGDPKWPERDRFVLSKPNACPALYAILARKGFFDRDELWSYRRLGAMLQGTLDPRRTPGIEAPGGGPGLGLGIANGIALASGMAHSLSRVFCLMGDGELNEGTIWESVATASLHRLNNLFAVVDFNGTRMGNPIEGHGSTEMLAARFEAFGWKVFHADGHCFKSLVSVFSRMIESHDGPSVMLAKTQWGRGVASAESGDASSRVPPNREKVENALLELERAGKSLEEESLDEP